MTNNALGYVVLMFFAGVGVPIMAALNSQLGLRLGNPWAASFLVFVVGGVISGCVLAAHGWPKSFAGAPIYFYLGGAFVALYALSVTLAAPKIGVGTAVFMVLLGQIFAAGVIDHFGLFGAARTPISLTRLGGMGLMLAGVFLARRVA
jgi:transporter family-2 protein